MSLAPPRLLAVCLSLGACTDGAGPAEETGKPAAAATDADGDGFGVSEDCRDDDAAVHPDATEECDGIDNDCDGEVDEDLTFLAYTDADGDGWGDGATGEIVCEAGSTQVRVEGDCDDADPEVHPEATEVCNGSDDDCDDLVDTEDDSLDTATLGTWYEDLDLDGYGDPEAPVQACEQPEDTSTDATDCDDADFDVSPAASEACNGVDDDCDEAVDEGLLGSGEACPAESCAAILADQPGALDGSYWLGEPAAEAPCDMQTDGGGWTRVLYWNRVDDGHSEADFQAELTEEFNNMTKWTEGSTYLKWCDVDTAGDAMSYDKAVDVPNGGEVLWSIQYEGLDHFYNSATWLYVHTADGTEEDLVCGQAIDEPGRYDATAITYRPEYDCSEYSLEIDWDHEDQQSTATAEVTAVSLTSLHMDTSCGDESRLYALEAWVR